MQRISRREFVKRTAVTTAAFTSLPAFLAACGESTGSNKVTKLVVAAVQGNEDGPLKKVVGNYKSETGVEVQVVEFPYDSLYSKLVTTFQANDSSYDLCMMDDPWMPKFGTERSKWSAAAMATGERSVAPWQPVRTLNMSANAAMRRRCVIPPAWTTVARI